MQDFLINRKIPHELNEKLRSVTAENEPVLFAIVGELTTESKYGQSILLATGSDFLVYDGKKNEVTLRVPYSSVESFYAKRMYGNGILRGKSKDDGKPIDIFRFNFSIAALCDAAVFFANKFSRLLHIRFISNFHSRQHLSFGNIRSNQRS